MRLERNYTPLLSQNQPIFRAKLKTAKTVSTKISIKIFIHRSLFKRSSRQQRRSRGELMAEFKRSLTLYDFGAP
ncbi:MAG: hypothetical protein A2428_16960 [Bdellovibrionales bacterium RIFOXYC1_FULL_54_43]|nr:MAG: hypothetical protein A2428_16960 [Bdellovibrionales bacterium RIFOXYC1_FULL_54_43]